MPRGGSKSASGGAKSASGGGKCAGAKIAHGVVLSTQNQPRGPRAKSYKLARGVLCGLAGAGPGWGWACWGLAGAALGAQQAPKIYPRDPQETPKRPPRDLSWPYNRRRGAQKAPKRPPRDPKRPPKVCRMDLPWPYNRRRGIQKAPKTPSILLVRSGWARAALSAAGAVLNTGLPQSKFGCGAALVSCWGQAFGVLSCWSGPARP